MPLFETVTDLLGQADIVRRWPYGVIEAVEGQFQAIHLRPWPKCLTPGALPLVGDCFRSGRNTDRCKLYYNQPRSCPNFLALRYVVSSQGARLGTVHRTLEALDAVAQIKGVDAIVCDAINFRISDRSLRRRGWEPHCPSRWHRHYIKRFYGEYPPLAEWIEPAVRIESFRQTRPARALDCGGWTWGLPTPEVQPSPASPCLTIFRGMDDETRETV